MGHKIHFLPQMKHIHKSLLLHAKHARHHIGLGVAQRRMGGAMVSHHHKKPHHHVKHHHHHEMEEYEGHEKKSHKSRRLVPLRFKY